ncbi:hypothetical protein PEP31012_00850 [Pandoraea eparura]|uniref:Phage tail protein n=1 Tax=Pandoraea eparura TaxID=2508291 RepID=A0A5E4SLZ5_9BURK|nr:hypothetical protein [Pandoraea eparura]VVD76121.1 hypothetical protein PEP31012_00850 [Pandoraea eparura]
MDYPKSVPGVGLVDGRFVDEDKTVPRVGSLIPAAWGNAITDEVLHVLAEGGLVPDEADPTQLAEAIKKIIDTRVSADYVTRGILAAAIGSSGAAASRNRLINSGAQVAIQTATPTLSSAVQYGPVEMIAGWASGGAITAGTLIQDTASPVGRTGYAVKFAGCTLTGAGVISWRYRMEAAEAVKLKNATAMFQMVVQHDVGAPVNYTVLLSKPTNTADDFSAVTAIATSAPVAVASGTATQLIPWQNGIALGDCSKGLNIEVQVACGAITTKNFWFTEWQLEEGTVATPLERRGYQAELAACQRYALNVPIGSLFINGWAGSAGAPVGAAGIDYPVEMRVPPTVPSISFALTQCNTPAIAYNTTRCMRLAATGTVSAGQANAYNNAAFVITARL